MITLRAFAYQINRALLIAGGNQSELSDDARAELDEEAAELEKRISALEDRNRELLAALCGIIHRAAVAELGKDLGGSVLDLCADNIPGVTLNELKEALKRAGLGAAG